MALDPSIPLQVRPFQMPDPMETVGRMQQMRAGQQQVEINDMRLRQAKAEEAAQLQATQEAQALQALFSRDRPPSPGEIYRIVRDPKRANEIVQGLAALRKTNFESEQALWRNVAQESAGILALPEPLRPQAYGLVRQKYVGLGVPDTDIPADYSPDVVKSFQMRAMTPEQSYAANQPKLTSVAPGSTLIDERNPQDGPVYTAPPKPPEPPNVGSFEDFVQRKYGVRPTPEQITRARQEYAQSGHVDTPPQIGSFEDFVRRKYGRNPTADQIEDARRTYQSASRPGVEIAAEMPSHYQTALERAIGSIPAARRGTWVQTANRLWLEGNEQELKGVIMQAAIEAEDVTTKNQVRNRQATIAALDDVESMLKDLKEAGVPTGWLSGNAEELMRRLGTSTDPRYVAIRNRMADTLINYRRAATGAAFSVAESSDYERMFPNYKQTFPVNQAAIQGLKRAIRTNDQVFWEGKLGKAGAALVGALPKADAPAAPDGDGWIDLGNGVRVREKK